MSKRDLFSRREVLSAAGLGAAVLALPRMGAAGSPVPSTSGQWVDLPGGAELAKAALDRYRSTALFRPAQPIERPGAEGSVRIDLGRGMKLEIEKRSPDRRAIVVEAPQGALELEWSRSRGVDRVVAQLEDESLTAHPRGYDTIRRVETGVELTFSDDLALRYATPERIPQARHPAVYDELAERVLRTRTESREPVKS